MKKIIITAIFAALFIGLLTGCAVKVAPYVYPVKGSNSNNSSQHSGNSSNNGNSNSGNLSSNSSAPKGGRKLSIDAPILFRGMEWSITHEEAKAVLEEEKINSIVYDYVLEADKLFDEYMLSIHGGGHAVVPLDKVSVGGYDTLLWRLFFHYEVDNNGINEETDSFYLATYQLDAIDYAVAYNALDAKLTELYGEGEEVITEKSGTVFALMGDGYSGPYTIVFKDKTWRGTNDTFVTLHCGIPDNEVYSIGVGVDVTYGVSSAQDDLEKIKQFLEEEAKRADREKGQSNDMSGL